MKVGILGGGQLGRMLALAGYPLGLTFRIFDPAPDACAAQVVPDHVVAPFDDEQALRGFADGLDLVTYEWENVPVETVRFLERTVRVDPPLAALEVAQDRLLEKELFRKLGIGTAPYARVDGPEDLRAALREVGTPAILKTRRLGYDGKGQVRVSSGADVEAAWRAVGGAPSIVEGFVPFARELSIIGVRRRATPAPNLDLRRQGPGPGPAAPAALHEFYPLVENVHRDGILRTSRAPAPASGGLQRRAEEVAAAVLEATDYAGVLAIELFEVEGQLLANEMAPRVHNSGHWTIEGAETSQFENHLRAVCGLPLGPTAPVGHSAMVNLIGAIPPAQALLRASGAHLHLYGKAPRPGRKVGHVTIRAGEPSGIETSLGYIERVIENEKG